MLFSRLIRKFAAVIAVLGLLFAQLATAAYTCPALAGAMQSAEDGVPPCHHSGAAQPGLCQAHCQDGQKHVGGQAEPASFDFVPTFVVALPERPAPAVAPLNRDDRVLVPPPLPHRLRNCVFRI